MLGQAAPFVGGPPRSGYAAQMDSCSRQNPAYRSATEEPRSGGALLLPRPEARGPLASRPAVAEDIHHPVFARLFDRLSRSMEPEVGPRRDQLLSGLRGRVLEIGAGNGMNFGHYPDSVEEVVAVEPEPYLRAKAERAAGVAAA